MDPLLTYPILRSTLSPFRRSQQKTLAIVIAALLEVAQANSLAVASYLGQWLGIRVKSAWNRFYRLLSNQRIDDLTLTSQLLNFFVGVGDRLVIAIDWTEWHSELRMLLASVVAGRRAIPVYAVSFDKNLVPRSQNGQENTFLQLLCARLREVGQTAVFLCDRGFRRVSWIERLQCERQHYVVRLMADVTVHLKGRKKTLQSLSLRRGQALDLGRVALRQDAKVTSRVIGVFAPSAKEPWWLATDLDEPIATIVALYDRRMTIEEQIRDTKGCRFGLKLEWTHFRTPAYLSRFMLLLGVALALWTVAGACAVHRDPSLELSCKKKGPRFSLVRIGVRWLGKIRSSAYIGLQFVRSFMPPPTLRLFDWLPQFHPSPTPPPKLRGA